MEIKKKSLLRDLFSLFLTYYKKAGINLYLPKLNTQIIIKTFQSRTLYKSRTLLVFIVSKEI